jgi:protein-S-isoprenylcysteine O-methyltransferase Ste14
MTLLDWLAFLVLGVQLPIPLFWLAVHPFVGFWRRRPRAVYALVGPGVWVIVDLALLVFREELFAAAQAPAWATAIGLALVVADICFIFRIHREFGGPRLFGHAELAGSRELATGGLFARVRHPRYTGMMASVLGACLVAATLRLWVAVAVWWVLVQAAVRLEERELRARFGEAYEEYARRVPRFLPFRFWPRE